MNDRPEIQIVETYCTTWGRCYHAKGRYYSGHYKERQQAVDAANAQRNRMRPLKKRGHQQSPRTGGTDGN